MAPSKKKITNTSTTSTTSTTTNDTCETPNIIIYISFTIMLIVKLIIITSLDNLEKSECRCAKVPQLKYLKPWFIFMVVYNFTILMLFLISNEVCWSLFIKHYYLYVLNLIIGFVNIIMLIQLFLYVRKLKNTCECGYGSKEKFIYWYLLIIFSIALVLFLLVIILSVITFVMLRK